LGGLGGPIRVPSLKPSHIVWTILKILKLATLGVQDGGYQGYYKNSLEYFFVFLELKRVGIKVVI
jgi:hypothetical protein